MCALENLVFHVGRAAHSMWMTDFPIFLFRAFFTSPACCAPASRLAFATVWIRFACSTIGFYYCISNIFST
jgi:hypothetical protein